MVCLYMNNDSKNEMETKPDVSYKIFLLSIQRNIMGNRLIARKSAAALHNLLTNSIGVGKMKITINATHLILAPVVRLSKVLVILVALAVSELAFAGTFKLDFTVENLGSVSPISGSFTWEATSSSAPIDNLASVSLTIDGYSYALSEIGFVNFTSSDDIAIGAGAGTLVVQDSTDDFIIRWDRTTGLPSQFVYATASCSCTPYIDNTGGSFTQFTITEVDSGTSISAQDHGFYQIDSNTANFNGFHNAVNNNYIARVTSTSENRNFFVFDLSGINETIASAKLQIESVSTSGNAGTLTIHDVDTPIATLTASHFVTDGISNAEGLDIFDDLGTGIVYGSTPLTPVNALCNPNVKAGTDPTCPSVIEEVELNAAGVAALNSASGLFAFGGRIDVGTVFGSSGAGQIGYFLVDLVIQTGDGTNELFTDSGQTLGSGNSESIALGDLDGDGDLDAFVGRGFFTPNTIWLNDGTGNFTDSGQALGTGSSLAVELADLNNDGYLDAFVANGNGNTANEPDQIWLNDSNNPGNFLAGQTLPAHPSFSLALGDIDGDGELDAITGSLSGFTGKVWIGVGDGTFTAGAFEFPNQRNVDSVSLADIDGDGDLDVVFGTGATDGTRVWSNNGDGTFSDTGFSVPSGRHYDVTGDVNGDGDQDIFVGESSAFNGQVNTILTNDGAGNFSPSGQSLGNSNTFALARGDLDGDIDLDIFVANNGDPDTVWLNDGSGSFSDSGLTLAAASGNNSVGVALGDLDGDGDFDAFVVDNGGADSVWINNSDTGQSDIDGDAVPDLIDPCPGDFFDSCNLNATTVEVIDSNQGGSLNTEIEDNIVEMEVPAESLSTDTTISITDQGQDFELTTDVGDSQSVFGINIGPDGTEFDPPAIITFAWADADNNGIVDDTILQETDLFVTKDGIQITLACSAEPTKCDTTLNTFTVEVASLSDFTLSGPLDTDGDGRPDNYDGVTDPCPNENATGFDVDGDSCIDDIDGLSQMISVLAMPPDAVIDATMENSLLSKLANAQKSADKDNICALVNQLEAFQAQVSAQIGKKISSAAAAQVLDYSNSVIAYVQFFLQPNESC